MLADHTRFNPIKVDMFVRTIGEQGAKHAFQSAYKNSTTITLDLEKLEQIKDIPCLIIWRKKDAVIPSDHAHKFKDILKIKDKYAYMIEDAGHSPHAEKPAIVYEKVRYS